MAPEDTGGERKADRDNGLPVPPTYRPPPSLPSPGDAALVPRNVGVSGVLGRPVDDWSPSSAKRTLPVRRSGDRGRSGDGGGITPSRGPPFSSLLSRRPPPLLPPPVAMPALSPEPRPEPRAASTARGVPAPTESNRLRAVALPSASPPAREAPPLRRRDLAPPLGFVLVLPPASSAAMARRRFASRTISSAFFVEGRAHFGSLSSLPSPPPSLLDEDLSSL